MNKVPIGVYGMVPVALLAEPWITLNAIKVYTAIASYQGTNGSAWPSRKALAERAGLGDVAKVSTATTLLEKHGWLVKESRAAQNKTTIYQVCFDVNPVTESVTTVTTPVTETVTSPVTESVTSIYIEKIKGKDHIPGAKAPAVSKPLSPMKDILATEYQDAFVSITPAEAWKSVPQERAQLNKLARLTRSLATVTEREPSELARAVMQEYQDMRQRGKGDYWRGAPFTPSGLVARWDQVIEALRDTMTIEDFPF